VSLNNARNTEQYILNNQQRPFAIQISIEIYNQIEEIIEDFSLIKLIEKVEGNKFISGIIDYLYYELLKIQNVEI